MLEAIAAAHSTSGSCHRQQRCLLFQRTRNFDRLAVASRSPVHVDFIRPDTTGKHVTVAGAQIDTKDPFFYGIWNTGNFLNVVVTPLYGSMQSETVGFGHHAVLLLKCSQDGARKPPCLSCFAYGHYVGRKPSSARRRTNSWLVAVIRAWRGRAGVPQTCAQVGRLYLPTPQFAEVQEPVSGILQAPSAPCAWKRSVTGWS